MTKKDYLKYGKRVAIIGASNNRNSVSNKAIRAFLDESFDVYPINPKETKIEGRVVYRDVSQIEDGVDIASIYISPEKQDKKLANSLRKAKTKLVIFNPGTENPKLEKQLIQYGLEVKKECSIVGLGRHPDEFHFE
ncbi:MAG: CoA-binding protein [Candidatus Aenigmarchaeota archaeon]|nr:CoA-binding protein [Candidatus Aenigmarchaeota archaeon]